MESISPIRGRGGRGAGGVSPEDLDRTRKELEKEIQRVRAMHEAEEFVTARRDAFGRFAYVDVTFNSTANGDTEVKHPLVGGDPEAIRVIPVSWQFASTPVESPYVWKNIASTRRPWGQGYVILRCNIASAQARLLLVSEAD